MWHFEEVLHINLFFALADNGGILSDNQCDADPVITEGAAAVAMAILVSFLSVFF